MLKVSAMDFLGKIFISHSSSDNPFVRQLVKKITDTGLHVWVDEHDLVVGDPLAEKIGNALSNARVILIIISKASVESKWLKYELNIATSRMVQGKCRVIPIVIDNAELPEEVQGLLYADCRVSLDTGWNSILTALQHENQRATQEQGFWAQADELIEQVFESKGWSSINGEYQSKDYEIVFLPVNDENNDEFCVAYEVISSYTSADNFLTESWWNDYYESTSIFPELLHLLVTERPIAFKLDAKSQKNPRVGIRSEWLKNHGLNLPLRHVVIANLCGISNREERKSILNEARSQLIELANAENVRHKLRKPGN